MRRPAGQGRSIVRIIHATTTVLPADKAVLPAHAGHPTWFGPPGQAQAYFDQYRTDRDRRTNPMEFDHIYSLPDQEEPGSRAEWAERYKKIRREPLFAERRG